MMKQYMYSKMGLMLAGLLLLALLVTGCSKPEEPLPANYNNSNTPSGGHAKGATTPGEVAK